MCTMDNDVTCTIEVKNKRQGRLGHRDLLKHVTSGLPCSSKLCLGECPAAEIPAYSHAASDPTPLPRPCVALLIGERESGL